MVKKLISVVLAAGLLITAFTASNSSNGKNASTISQQVSSTAEPTKAEPVKIKLSHQQGEWIWPILTELTKQWQDKTGNSVELVYNYNDGILNTILKSVGLENLTHIWLGEKATALPSLLFLGFPWIGRFGFLILLSAFQSIDTSMHESTEIDGANSLKNFFK